MKGGSLKSGQLMGSERFDWMRLLSGSLQVEGYYQGDREIEVWDPSYSQKGRISTP